MLPVAILAGGLATRLRPITETIPKALVDVAGEPFIIRQLRYLRAQGLQRIVLCIGYLGEMIQAIVGDGSKFGLDITYSPDGPVLLGTGGALKQALPLLGERFFVLYGDSFLPVAFAPIEQAFFASNKTALMTVLENGDRWDKSNVLYREGELVEYNKHAPKPDMAYIDYGLGVLAGKVLDSYPDGQAFDLAEVYHALSLDGQLAGYEVHERFYEIGSHNGLKETETYFLEKGEA
ncbi:NTP transferase domain-containing protein [Candidatus Methylospira mobilis]|uniref:NTP transferase domain-containing protein n=1 Tax=Candidatus Methylospira mobilis TaxID=1808979 RepID=A0A5Q0BQW9_9GAMM|nr:nucleotidyltransferase family protein [Candidatus Methylospira mobilis]QFY44477.1 NTP transferase domain-containing protein [Candidatus Methylospira mobilis]WNV06094.1 nucleotidyltransferase family protein [Candidatus Methylospira mobilis]